MKNRLGAAKRRCQQKKHWMTSRELVLGPHRDFFFRVLQKSCGSSGFIPPGVHFAPGLMCRRYAGLGGHSGRSGTYRVEAELGFVDLLAEAGVGGVLATGAAIAAPTAGCRPVRRGAGSRSRGCQRGMVVKAAGCAGQGILILAWLETRDHFNPFALRASEDFPVDVDRPT